MPKQPKVVALNHKRNPYLIAKVDHRDGEPVCTAASVNSLGYDSRASCRIGVWAGFAERHRSRRRPVDHDFLDPLRAVALGSRVQFDHDQTQSAMTGPAGDRRHQPARQYWQQGQGRASPQWLLRYCQGATLSAVPRMANRPRMRPVPIGRLHVETATASSSGAGCAPRTSPSAEAFVNSAASRCGVTPTSKRSSLVAGLLKQYASL
jgi:hypothetical protein